MNITKVISTFVKDQIRIIKVLRYGKNDVQTGREASPYGIDSNPIAGMEAIYAETSGKGDKVIIGYINKNKVAAVGEYRIFSTDEDGNLQFFIWLKADGTCQIGGSADNAVRYAPLAQALGNEKLAINVELAKIQAAIAGLGGAYAKVDISLDVSSAKINQISTP